MEQLKLEVKCDDDIMYSTLLKKMKEAPDRGGVPIWTYKENFYAFVISLTNDMDAGQSLSFMGLRTTNQEKLEEELKKHMRKDLVNIDIDKGIIV